MLSLQRDARQSGPGIPAPTPAPAYVALTPFTCNDGNFRQGNSPLVKYGLFVLLTKPRGAAARQPAPLPWPHTLLQASASSAPSVSDPQHQQSAHLLLQCRWVLELRSPLRTAERCFRFRPAAKLTGLEKLDSLASRRIQDRKSRTYNSYSNAAFLLLSPTSEPRCKPRLHLGSWHPGAAPWSIFYITLCVLCRFSHI